jgi:NTP pyrophosphatase (non-canonical NTP hydrolase)
MSDETKEDMSVNDWCTACYETSKSKGWHESDVNDNVFNKLLLMHAEISEAVEELRANHPLEEVYFKDGKPEGAIVELADVMIRCFDLCGSRGIDLQSVIKLKHEYNKTRPHRHGGKVI